MSKHEDHSDAIKKAEDIFRHEISQMKDYAQQAHEIQDLIKQYKLKTEESQKILIRELSHLNRERQKHEAVLRQFESLQKQELTKGVEYKNEYTQKKKQRVSLAEKIDIKELIDLQIDDRKSEAHEVFKWILSVVYKQPVAKYYWDNFKKQAFKEDKGIDFKERMGKISAADLKEDEKVATQKLISSRDKLVNHAVFEGDVRQCINNILEIAQLIIEGAQIAKKTKDLEAEDAQLRAQKILKEEVFKKAQAKCAAMQDRINLTQNYLELLQTISKQMSQKAKRYQQGAKQGNKIMSELKSLHSESAKSTYLEIAKKGEEVCTLF